jgi:hypothetical protein
VCRVGVPLSVFVDNCLKHLSYERLVLQPVWGHVDKKEGDFGRAVECRGELLGGDRAEVWVDNNDRMTPPDLRCR